MARKKRKIPHGGTDPAREARRRARAMVGLPPRERVIPDKRHKPPKHKKELLENEIF